MATNERYRGRQYGVPKTAVAARNSGKYRDTGLRNDEIPQPELRVIGHDTQYQTRIFLLPHIKWFGIHL